MSVRCGRGGGPLERKTNGRVSVSQCGAIDATSRLKTAERLSPSAALYENSRRDLFWRAKSLFSLTMQRSILTWIKARSKTLTSLYRHKKGRIPEGVATLSIRASSVRVVSKESTHHE